MSEKKVQSKIVMEYSQKHPEKHGTLWSTRNTTLSVKDGMTQRAMGMVSGVSDLIHFENSTFTGFEIKEPGSRHDAKHILNQINWAKKIISNGGRYFFITSTFDFWQFIQDTTVKTNIHEIEKRINDGEKTIKF